MGQTIGPMAGIEGHIYRVWAFNGHCLLLWHDFGQEHVELDGRRDFYREKRPLDGLADTKYERSLPDGLDLTLNIRDVGASFEMGDKRYKMSMDFRYELRVNGEVVKHHFERLDNCIMIRSNITNVALRFEDGDPVLWFTVESRATLDPANPAIAKAPEGSPARERLENLTWLGKTERRYNEFDELHSHMLAYYRGGQLKDNVPSLPFPRPKWMFDHTDPGFVQERREALQAWIGTVARLPRAAQFPRLQAFLKLPGVEMLPYFEQTVVAAAAAGGGGGARKRGKRRQQGRAGAGAGAGARGGATRKRGGGGGGFQDVTLDDSEGDFV